MRGQLILKNEEYIYMDCKIRMSTRAMANLMYAAIITQSGLPTSFGVGIYDYERSQNAYNMVDVKVHIHPSQIERFELESTVKLIKPLSVTIN